MLWGLCAQPDDPESAFEAFFKRWPQWAAEYAPLERGKAWATLTRKLGGLVVARSLASDVRDALGSALLSEVEGRLLFTLAGDHQKRHGGVLRAPADLNPFAAYDRPDIIRHFGRPYDPAKHNTGMMWFGSHGVIITKLDTSGAIGRHQYNNAFLSPDRFSWTSQNRMGVDNDAGRKVLEHAERGFVLHLFVQPRSHQPALYCGAVDVVRASGAGPMTVEFRLRRALPDLVQQELGVSWVERENLASPSADDDPS